jgi:hypothetical protein
MVAVRASVGAFNALMRLAVFSAGFWNFEELQAAACSARSPTPVIGGQFNWPKSIGSWVKQ